MFNKVINYIAMKKSMFALLFLCFAFMACAQSISHTDEEAKHTIDSLYTALVNGADFKVMADTYSEDPGTKGKGGMYSNVALGSFVPEFEAATLSLNVMEVSKPFKTQFGYHVVQLLKKEPTTFTVRHILIKVN